MITGWQIKTISRGNNNQTIYEGALQSFVVDQVSYVSTPGRPGTSSSPTDPHHKSPLKLAGLQVPYNNMSQCSTARARKLKTEADNEKTTRRPLTTSQCKI